MFRVLMPGGVALLAFHVGTEDIHLDEWWDMPVRLDFRFFSLSEIEPLLRAAGFEILESLERGYDLVRSRGQHREGAVVRLVDVWGVLTLLPGQQREYMRAEFARDLYLLDSSAVATAKSGRALRWHASSGTRGSGTLATVAQTGQQQLYWGISFTERS